MAAPDWLTSGRCSCGWGCTCPHATPLPLEHCRLLGRCDCGWGCLRPRNEPPQITWTEAFRSRSAADLRIYGATSEYCFRLGDLAYFASRFDFVVLHLNTVAQIREWFWWLADQQRIADRYLARARSFDNAVTAARWTLRRR